MSMEMTWNDLEMGRRFSSKENTWHAGGRIKPPQCEEALCEAVS